jgi:HEAT repeat protein
LRDAHSTIDLLIGIIEHGHEDAKPLAADLLGYSGDVRAVDPLLLALDGVDWKLRIAAAGALGKMGDARALEPLLRALQQGDDEFLRRAAATALGGLGDMRALEPLRGILVTPAAHHELRATAARALGCFRDVAARHALIAVLDPEVPRAVRRAAATTLKGMPSDDLAVRARVDEVLQETAEKDMYDHGTVTSSVTPRFSA